MIYLKIENSMKGSILVVYLNFLYVCVGGGGDVDVKKM